MTLKAIALTTVVTAGLLHGAAVRGSVVYVTNFNGGTISTVPSGGGTPTTFATGLSRPEGIALGPSGTLYVDNQLAGVIDRVSAAGAVSPVATIPLGSNVGVAGLVTDAAGNLYVSVQSGTNTGGLVDKVTPSGAVSTYATGVGNPQGLAFGPAGTLFVADVNNGRIDEVAPGGGVATVFATLPSAEGVATDPAGDVYGSSQTGNLVEEFSPAGSDLRTYGSVPTPHGITFDAAGDLLASSATVNGTGTTVYAIPPGGGAATPFSTGLDGPYYVTTAVPEPAAAGVLVAAGGVGLFGRRRQRA